MRLLAFLLWTFFGALGVSADIAGESDPRFKTALTQWLGGQDDLAALHGLAALARDGNTAAQVTLGLIEQNRAKKDGVIAQLSREDRRSIFRDPEGAFGRPWLRVAAGKSAYAAVRAAPMSPENTVTSFAAAIAEGDLRFAWQLAMIEFNHSGMPSAAARLAHPRLLPHTAAVLEWILAIFDRTDLQADRTPAEREILAEVRATLAANPAPASLMPALSSPLQGRRNLQPDAEDMRRVGAALLDEPALEPIATVVRAACPEDTALHMGVVASTRSIFPLTLLQTSPLVPIVDTETWQQSARFGRDTLLEVMVFPDSRALIDRVSPCLLNAAD